MTRTQDADASQTDARPNIHHDLIIERLDIARAIGLVTDYVVNPVEPPQRLETSVTVRRSANTTDGAVKDYLADLLKGVVSASNIVVTTTACAPGAVPEAVSPEAPGPVPGETVAAHASEPPQWPGLSPASRRELQGSFNPGEPADPSVTAVPFPAEGMPRVGRAGECAVPWLDTGDSTRSAPFSRSAHLHQVAAAGAMLTCIAIILNVGPFAKAPRNASPPVALAAQSAPPVTPKDLASIPARDADERGSARLSQYAEAAQTLPEPIRALMEPSPFVAAEVASPVVKAAEAAPPIIKASYQREDRDGVEPPDPTPVNAVTQHPADHANAERPAIVGVWAPDVGTCSARDFQDGLLPTVINNEGAWAGETFCLFSNRKETEAGWTVVAKCTSPRGRWTSNVRLTVNENRLIWTSKRGTQVYSRCAPDVLMAQAR